MPKPADRRRDHEMRKVIDEYRALAAQARAESESASDDNVRRQFLSLANAWDRLADALAGRPRP